MIKLYLLTLLISFSISFGLTPLVRRLSQRMGWMDKPNYRKVNKKPMPLLGGLAIYIGFAFSMWFMFSSALSELGKGKILGLLASSFIIILVGIADDIKGLSPRRKLFYQLVAATIAYSFGFSIIKVSGIFGDALHIPAIIGFGLTLFWIIGFTNAVNLLDGLDGLASGVVAIIAASLFLTAVKDGNLLVSIFTLGLIGSILGFLPYNFPPAKIFMGDTGSMFLGFALALISMEGAYKGSTFVALFVPLIAMGIPVVDTALAILRRLIKENGINGVFKADKEHVHHKLLTQEGSQKKAVLKLYFLTLCFGSIAVGFSGMKGFWAYLAIILVIIATLRWILNFELLDFGGKR